MKEYNTLLKAMESNSSTPYKILDFRNRRNSVMVKSCESMISSKTIVHAVEEIRKNPNTEPWTMPMAFMERVSRNKNFYPKAHFMEALQSKFIKERLDRNIWFGEFSHPKGPDLSLSRMLEVVEERWSHRISKYSVNGNVVYGECYWMPQTEVGRTVKRLVLEQGCMFSLSLRSIAENTRDEMMTVEGQESKVSVKLPPIILVTFDMVELPGFFDASMSNSNLRSLMSGAKNIGAESLLANSIEEYYSSMADISLGTSAEEFREFIGSDSREASECLESLGINNTNNLVIINQEGLASYHNKYGETIVVNADNIPLMQLP